ncbi:MAG: alpha/beta fold hydrolase, partial [Thermoleophilia bacterium]|nr:alpha/beta fold hydrolase [Thermoleophilia bacterium]
MNQAHTDQHPTAIPARPPRAAKRTIGKNRVLAAIAAVAVLVVVIAIVLASATRTPPVATHHQFITVVNGQLRDEHVSLDTQVYVPAGVSSQHQAPAVLLSHGFGGSRHTLDDQARYYARHGYVVLAYSARGFGRSGGRVALDSRDYEARDVEQLIDWLARRDYVKLDNTGDPSVALIGGSYGGGISLMAAAADARVDAVVPSITWNNMITALSPNAAQAANRPIGLSRAWAPSRSESLSAAPVGVFKKAWAAGMFSAAGNQASPTVQEAGGQATPAPGSSSGPSTRPTVCGRFTEALCSTYSASAAGGKLTPATAALLTSSSPSSYLSTLHAPTMLVQGETDSLFPLSEADATARALADNNVPHKVIWIEGGHDGTPSMQDTAFVRKLTVRWLDRFLRNRKVDTGPGFVFALPGTSLAGTVPTGHAAHYTGDVVERKFLQLQGGEQVALNPPGGSPSSLSTLPGAGFLGAAASAFGGFDIPNQRASFTTSRLTHQLDVVGSSLVQVRLWSDTGQAALFAKLEDVDGGGGVTLPQGLAAPLRVTGLQPRGFGPGRAVTVALPAIAHRFVTGHRLRVTFATTDQAYANEPRAAAYAVALMPNETFASTARGGSFTPAATAHQVPPRSVSVPLAPGGAVPASRPGPVLYIALAWIATALICA